MNDLLVLIAGKAQKRYLIKYERLINLLEFYLLPTFTWPKSTETELLNT